MKLSNDTLSVLKNFGSINQGLLFNQGKTLKTVSSLKNILAEATINEEIPTEFGVYDLNNFLSVVSLHKDDPSFEFSDNNVVIVGNGGRSKILYRFCAGNLINTPPEKALTMPDPEVSFSLSAEDFEWILRAASVLSSPQIAIESDGTKINIVTLDLQNDSAHTDSLELPVTGTGDKFRMIFKTEVISKLMSGSYDVKISSKGISQFTNQKNPIKYWVTTEPGSKFEKAE